ncbi:FAD binding domain-containing protein [Candidatus Entotheonella palauensis]|uniref:FAD binding domain-containing protein n=1 Tax=Candidatus Entotheonella palauensis TaxID=93172 RepID=UPI000B7F7671|nr:xanthine dehydrogenase family protein subunit M [Candidatus Entotheonella palauensis]
MRFFWRGERTLDHFDYVAPATLAEAIGLLQAYQSRAAAVKILAGGTDLFLRMRHRVETPGAVIDIKRIPELGVLSHSDADGLHIGAAVCHADVVRNENVRQSYGALAEAASWVGSRQTRHRGTVVGNLCNASPAADTTPALLAYRAAVRIVGPEGERDVPVETFFRGPGQTVLTPVELVTAVVLPPPEAHGWGFLRRTRTAIDIALVSSCAVVTAANGTCQDVSIGLGAVAPTPIRARQAEDALRGQQPTEALTHTVGRLAAANCSPISDVRCSGDYRKQMVNVLTRRCVQSSLRMLQLL